MRKRIIDLFLILICIIFIGYFIFITYDNVKLKSDIKKLEDKQINNTGECTFIKTLRVIDILDYNGTVPEVKFILVDSFQSFYPFVLQVGINDDFKEGLYYEFTFKGLKEMYTNNDSSLVSFQILSINKTDRVGLSQIQEPCK